MDNFTKNTAGRQIVVFDEITSTLPGGKHLDRVDAIARFPDGVIPAGTVVVPAANGKVAVLNVAITAPLGKSAIGLVSKDTLIDDFPIVALIVAGTARIDALPALEKTGVAFVSAGLPRITFY